MSRVSYRELVRNFAPPWLSDRYPRPLTTGFRYLYAQAAVLDSMMQILVEGLRAKYPTQGTTTAVPYIGRDRRIVRGPNEDVNAFAERLIPWLDAWRGAGSALEVIRQMTPIFAPHPPPRMRIVTNAGTWYTYDPNADPITIEERGNWNWDNRPDLWARCWLILYSPDGEPWSPDGTWGDGNEWGDGRCWGLTITRPEVIAAQSVLAQWKAGHTLYPNIIVAFDENSFDPDAPEPDGTWRTFYKLVDGVATPSRLATARYMDGAS